MQIPFLAVCCSAVEFELADQFSVLQILKKKNQSHTKQIKVLNPIGIFLDYEFFKIITFQLHLIKCSIIKPTELFEFLNDDFLYSERKDCLKRSSRIKLY